MPPRKYQKSAADHKDDPASDQDDTESTGSQDDTLTLSPVGQALEEIMDRLDKLLATGQVQAMEIINKLRRTVEALEHPSSSPMAVTK